MALLGFAVMAISIWGCNAGQRPPESGKVPAAGQEGERMTASFVVTTIFPYYDFVRQIAGDRVKLKLVVPAGMDSHSFEPTPADMIAAQGGRCADLQRRRDGAVGGESAGLPGHQPHEGSDHDGLCGRGGGRACGRHGGGRKNTAMRTALRCTLNTMSIYGPPPVNARAIVKIISQTLSEAAPREKSRFEDNTQAYLEGT